MTGFLSQVAVENVILELLGQVDTLKQILAQEKENARQELEKKLNSDLVGTVFGGFTFLYKISSFHLRADETCYLVVDAILMSTVLSDSHIILKKDHVVEYSSAVEMEKDRFSQLVASNVFDSTWRTFSQAVDSVIEEHINKRQE